MSTDPAPATAASILLVDDDRLVLAMLSDGLERLGYRVGTAESAEEAEVMLIGGYRPDLAILDVRLPGRSGLELADRLRLFDHVPFMLLSAYGEPAIVDRAAECGALGFVVKPVDLPQLIPAMEAALARAKDIAAHRRTEDQLRAARDAERDINTAIGITMVQHRLKRAAAFELLRGTARRERRKLSELSAEIVRAAETLYLNR